MAKFEKNDIVLFGKEKYKVEEEYKISNGLEQKQKYYISNEAGDKLCVDEKDLKKADSVKSLDELIKESLKESAKETKIDEKKKEEILEKVMKEAPEKKQGKTTDKERDVSFSVITRDYVNGRANGYEPRETIIHGKTKDDINYEATVYGNKNLSRSEVEQIAASVVKDADLTTSRQDKAFNNDRIQSMLNDNNADYVIYTNGHYVTGEEINDDLTLEEAENLEDFGDLYTDSDDGKTGFDDLVADLADDNGPSAYTSFGYDSPEEEMDDLMALSGMEDIVER